MVSLIVIPKATEPTRCKGCRQTIYFAPHGKNGTPHPISIRHADARLPSATEDGKGISHFADCPDAPRFRQRHG